MVELDKVFESMARANAAWLKKGANEPGDGPQVNFADAWSALLSGSAAPWRMLGEATGQYYRQQIDLALRTTGATLNREREPVATSGTGERRFNGPEWPQWPLFDYFKQSHRLISTALLEAIDAADLDDKTRKQVLFHAKQFLDATSPANFALTNPDVLKLALETKGESVASGFKNLLQDLKEGRISMSDAGAFQVGGNLANTPGSVVYENDLIQLIQYRPTTEMVKEIPLLFVPSVVNKYYILDLAPQTSLVRYLVAEGFTVFMMSWRNVSREQQQLTWDDYVQQGVQAAVDVVRNITRQDQINAVGYCTGGALLASALAARASQGERPVANLTLLMTMLEFSDPGEIGVFLDPATMAQFEASYANGGVVPGRELTLAFSSLRANDLIWSFVVNNYLKGKTPEAFDLFYWNTDDSNLAGPMFCYYLRNCYIQNKLVQPNALTASGAPIDLRRIDVPTYVFAASQDHLVPWRTAYQSVNHLGGEMEFVLGGGGHITGPINPVSRNKRSYQAGGRLGSSADDWQNSARSVSGSWWPHWRNWLDARSGQEIAAPKRPGNRSFKEIEPAPGRYVKERST